MVNRSFRRLLILAAAGLGLSACAVAGISSYMILAPGGYDLFAYAASRGDVRVVVLNNPFALPRAEVEAAVVDALATVPPGGPKATYSTNPRPGSRMGIRFVFAFDPADGQSQHDLCLDNPTLVTSPQGDLLKMLSVLCDGGTIQSWATATIARPATPRAPAFQSMISNGAWVQIPRNDPLVTGDCDDDC